MFSDEECCSLRWHGSRSVVEVLDQTLLPYQQRWLALASLPQFCHAISTMQVRGAPLIGITAAFGLARALAEDASLGSLQHASTALAATRPTAVNLRWALERVSERVRRLPPQRRATEALHLAQEMRRQDISSCESIGEFGLARLRALSVDGPVNVMTHCNAGWLATVQWGTALAPIYKAHAAGLPVHVWVSETRPRNQGALLTAWELRRAGVPCTVVADNSCGLLMRQGRVDCVIVGSDRTASNGDVCNKIGTYLKALAARDNGIPFYVALPLSTVDFSCANGDAIVIEQRDGEELLSFTGPDGEAVQHTVSAAAPGAIAHNPAFDITPGELVSELITEVGTCRASTSGLSSLRETVKR